MHRILNFIPSIILGITVHLCSCTGCGEEIVAGDAGADGVDSEDLHVDPVDLSTTDEGEADPELQDDPWPDEARDDESLEDPGEEIEVPAPLYWAESLGGTEDEMPWIIERTSDGCFIVAGASESFGGDPFSSWVLKLDLHGNILWQKIILTDEGNAVSSVRETDDGGFIAAGGTMSGDQVEDILVIKFDRDGHVAWQKTYGDANYNGANDVRQTADGGYVLAGATQSPDETMFQVLIVKIDTMGNIVWEKAYAGDGSGSAYAMGLASDGGFIVAGMTNSPDDPDVLVMKLDAEGNVEWQETLGGAGSDSAHAICNTVEGGYFLAGVSDSFNSEPGDIGDYWLVKIDSTGSVVWQSAYDEGSVEGALSIDATSDGGIVVGGMTHDTASKMMVLRLDSFGSILWQKTYRDGLLAAVRQTLDGGFILAECTETYGAGLLDFMVLKVDEAGIVSESCPPDFGEESSAVVVETSATAMDATLTPGDVHLTVADSDFTVADTGASPVVHCRR